MIDNLEAFIRPLNKAEAEAAQEAKQAVREHSQIASYPSDYGQRYTAFSPAAYDATIRAAAESDGVIPDAVKVEAMARAMYESLEFVRPWEDPNTVRIWLATNIKQAQAALNALRALEGEDV